MITMTIQKPAQTQVSDIITPEVIACVATRMGLGANSDLTPAGYRCLLDKVTELVSKKLQHSGATFNTQAVRRDVDSVLSQARVVDRTAQDYLPEAWLQRLTHCMWRLSQYFSQPINL